MYGMHHNVDYFSDASATESKLGSALFYNNAKDGAWLCTTLDKMGHPQPATPTRTDNVRASGIANASTAEQRCSKAIARCF
jgi:hypothetical protein